MNPRFTVSVPGAEMTFIRRGWSTRARDNSAPRMYVDVKDETILDNLANRRRRPYNVYKTLIHGLDLEDKINIGRLTWSQYAGCTCPCSPGFILPHQVVSDPETGEIWHRFDVWITLTGAPAVNEAKAPRILVGA